ncbi:MAG: NAD(P)/FAD-dependent oxidoreductase [Thalassobaculaceae bacterium]|nr:NAD(P)/FAD-dependent oxidoreductase [Thalassobaculaceae bacterium]
MTRIESTAPEALSDLSEVSLSAIVEHWVAGLETALKQSDTTAIAGYFARGASWRDALGFAWNIDTVVEPREIADAFSEKLAKVDLRSFQVSDIRHEPIIVTRGGVEVIEAFVAFDTATGPGEGVVRLVRGAAGDYKAWVLLTALCEIRGHHPWQKVEAEEDASVSREFGGENWADKRRKALRYDDREPCVLVIGAGQAGLSIAAQLKALEIDTLIVDRHGEVGDNWRKRYHSLALHNEVNGNHLPFMPFPPSFPKFVPKDKLADWFKAYAEALDLNVWMNSPFVGGDYDEEAGHWTITVVHEGSRRTLKPKHLVFATGVSAIPVHPELPGLDDFAGAVVHSGAYGDGKKWAGKTAVVLGTGNSAHDVAQDLHASGASVSMVQRSPTTVLSLGEAQKLYALYREPRPLDEADLLAMAVPHPVLVETYKMLTKSIRQADADLLQGLADAGFKLDFGEDGTGFQMKYLTRGGGYYFNVGCSDLIIAGEIGIIQFADIDRFVPDGIRMKDGSLHAIDLLVTATGFLNQQDVVRVHLGDRIADKIGPVWGFGDEMELRNMWQKTPQKGLWFNAGSMTQCRIYSRYLALQIKAEELELT